MTGTSAVLAICGAIAFVLGWTADKYDKHRERDLWVSLSVILLCLALVFN